MQLPRRTRMLRVDLSSGVVEEESIPERWRRRYVGGKGLGARYLYDELDAGVDPLAPENVLLFVLGPLSGLTPGEQRYAAVTKSPLTGTFLDSYGGGSFPARLAGSLPEYLGVLVTGRAEEPTALVLDDDGPSLESATDLAGATVPETCDAFDGSVACVGPAGEREVLYATIASDGGDHHAGRGGAGAVMGSKNLKAVVARGDPPEGLAALRGRYERRFADGDVGRWQATSETLETVDFANEVGALPTRGWQTGTFDGASEIGIEAVREAATGRERADDSVPGGFRFDDGDASTGDASTGDASTADASTNDGDDPHGTTVLRGATPISLGSGLGIDDFDAVSTLGGVCDSLGVDVISAGNAVAWAVHASEANLLGDESAFDGISFGDADAAHRLIEAIARRESPLGDALADGVAAAATQFGGDDLVPTVKAMELPAYDPRAAKTMALAYATSDRGACHRRAHPIEQEAVAAEEWSVDDRVDAVVREQDTRSLLWSLIVDDFAGAAFESDLGGEWLSALDHPAADADLRTTGERIWTLVRLFNVREGFTREDDTLPPTLQEPLPDGPNAGESVSEAEFTALLDAYYAERGWTDDGRPTRAILARLDLGGIYDRSPRTPKTGETSIDD